jgi:hypothetical protein
LVDRNFPLKQLKILIQLLQNLLENVLPHLKTIYTPPSNFAANNKGKQARKYHRMTLPKSQSKSFPPIYTWFWEIWFLFFRWFSIEDYIFQDDNVLVYFINSQKFFLGCPKSRLKSYWKSVEWNTKRIRNINLCQKIKITFCSIKRMA